MPTIGLVRLTAYAARARGSRILDGKRTRNAGAVAHGFRSLGGARSAGLTRTLASRRCRLRWSSLLDGLRTVRGGQGLETGPRWNELGKKSSNHEHDHQKGSDKAEHQRAPARTFPHVIAARDNKIALGGRARAGWAWQANVATEDEGCSVTRRAAPLTCRHVRSVASILPSGVHPDKRPEV